MKKKLFGLLLLVSFSSFGMVTLSESFKVPSLSEHSDLLQNDQNEQKTVKRKTIEDILHSTLESIDFDQLCRENGFNCYDVKQELCVNHGQIRNIDNIAEQVRQSYVS